MGSWGSLASKPGVGPVTVRAFMGKAALGVGTKWGWGIVGMTGPTGGIGGGLGTKGIVAVFLVGAGVWGQKCR